MVTIRELIERTMIEASLLGEFTVRREELVPRVAMSRPEKKVSGRERRREVVRQQIDRMIAKGSLVVAEGGYRLPHTHAYGVLGRRVAAVVLGSPGELSTSELREVLGTDVGWADIYATVRRLAENGVLTAFPGGVRAGRGAFERAVLRQNNPSTLPFSII